MRPKWCLRILLNLTAILGGGIVACIVYFRAYPSDNIKSESSKAYSLENHVRHETVSMFKNISNHGHTSQNLVRNEPSTKISSPVPQYPIHRGSFMEFKANKSEYSFKVDSSFQPTTCPTSIQYKMMNNSWAKTRFRPQIQKFMHKGMISRQEYDRLMAYSMPFGYRYIKDNMSYEELHDVINKFPEDNSIFNFSVKPRPKCISCAVVGNGGILNGSKMGPEIDSHDMVFRVNHCIRRGHEEDVGKRTTHYVFMDRSLVHTRNEDVPKDEGIRYIFLPCRKADYKYIKIVVGAHNAKLKLQTAASNVHILHPDFVRYSHKIWESTRSFRPTTGGMMLFTALHTCDSVSVYGMGFTKEYSEHYYDTKFIKFKNVKGSHDFKKEISIMETLDNDGIIKWFQRDVTKWMR